VSGHIRALQPGHLEDVESTDRHTVKPWFAGKIPFTFEVPELQNTGFSLIGGRVVYFQHNPGAQLLFRVRQHMISAFILREDAAGPAFAFASRSANLAFHTETWTSDGLRYVLISDVAASDLHQLAELLKAAARR
jgi:anti-sigma factor RsiW